MPTPPIACWRNAERNGSRIGPLAQADEPRHAAARGWPEPMEARAFLGEGPGARWQKRWTGRRRRNNAIVPRPRALVGPAAKIRPPSELLFRLRQVQGVDGAQRRGWRVLGLAEGAREGSLQAQFLP